MANKTNGLNEILAPLHERVMRVEDYRQVGSGIVDAAFRSPSIRRDHGLGISSATGSKLIEWERDGTDFTLMNSGESEVFFLTATLSLAAGLTIKDVFLFGDEQVAKDGLVYVVHDVARAERTSRSYANIGILSGKWRRDGTGPLKVTPTRYDKAVFKQTLLTIGEVI